MLARIVLYVVVTGVTVFGSDRPVSKKSFDFENVLYLTPSEFHELIKTPTVLQVYFIVKENFYFTLKSFFIEYEKAAKNLEKYNIKLAVMDCIYHKNAVQYCSDESVHKNIYSFQNGELLLKMEIEFLFDLESIMAHSIQIPLVGKVPVLLSRLERQALENKMAGVKNIIFAYLPAVGTKEHSIFIEVAFAYQDSYQFALTTDVSVTEGLKYSQHLTSDTVIALWVLFCASSTQDDLAESGSCTNIIYKDKVSLAGLAAFIKHLEEPVLYHCPSQEISTLLDMPRKIFVIFIYLKEFNQEIQEDVEVLTFNVRGLAKIVIMDMNIKECLEFAQLQGVQGMVPVITIHKMSGKIVQLNQSTGWNVDTIQEFIETHVFSMFSLMSENVEQDFISTDMGTFSEGLIREVETQDDAVADAVFRLQLEDLDLSFIPAYLKENFAAAIQSAELKLVLFYLPFDHVGMAFLSDLSESASNFTHLDVLMRVNCFDATDLCAKENITTYPVLKIYQRNKEPQDYKGHLHSPFVLRAIKLLQLKSPVKLNTEEEVNQFMQGKFPMDFSAFTPSSMILLSSSDDKETRLIFKEVTKSLSTETAFGIVTKKLVSAVAQKYGVSVPAVIAHCRIDTDQPVRILKNITVENLMDFAKMSTYKTLPELKVNNFPPLFAKKLPFVILFLDSNDTATQEAVKLMTKLAMSGQFENVIFCTMNARPKTMGIKILSAYTWIARLPMITFVNHRLGEVFNFEIKELKEDEVISWLKDVLSGNLKPSKKLMHAVWTAPGKYYDFLALTDAVKGTRNIDRDFDALAQERISHTHPDSGDVLSYENYTGADLQEDEVARTELLEIYKTRHQDLSKLSDNAKPSQDIQREPIKSQTVDHVEL